MRLRTCARTRNSSRHGTRRLALQVIPCDTARMSEAAGTDYGDDRYFTRLAAAYVRGKLGRDAPRVSHDELIAAGLAGGLRLHKFKRSTELPRVRKVLGLLRGLSPASLLDVGSGRGTFLWPLLDAFP